MDAKNLPKLVEHLKKEIQREVNDRLPRKVGITAVNHFKQNFRDGGFMNGGLHPWKPTKRQQQPSNAGSRYSPLTSARNHLMSSLEFHPGVGQVRISNPVPYAAIHNEGGNINTHPRVTPKMRKFAWAMAYHAAGVKRKGKLPKELPYEAKMWRALALTKKTTLSIHANIPQRQFMGESQELTQKVNRIVHESIQRIKDGISDLSNH